MKDFYSQVEFPRILQWTSRWRMQRQYIIAHLCQCASSPRENSEICLMFRTSEQFSYSYTLIRAYTHAHTAQWTLINQTTAWRV